MPDALLEAYMRQLVESQQDPDVTVAWQGGVAKLMGIDFFRRSIELERSIGGDGYTFENTIQIELLDSITNS